MSYRLRTLGSIEILAEDGSEIGLRSAKHTALFLYLNANSRRKHLRSELCELLWTTERSRARHSLSQALYDIRSRVGPVVATSGGEGVSLDAPGAWYDVDALEDRMASDDPAAAVELYGGPFAVELDEVGTDGFEHWLESERRRIRVLGRNAYRQHIVSLEEQGAWKRLAAVARQFLKRAPDDLEAQRSFIRSLWLGGDRASALEYFASLRERRPDQAEQLRSLADRIEGRAPDRVRETLEPEESPLVGREVEMRRLRRISRSVAEPTAVHVEGEAGVGKTRLVQELTNVLGLSGFRLIQSRCWEAESDVPYSAVAESLEPWLGPDSDAAADFDELELARAALFPSSSEPGDLILDREALKELRRRIFEEVTTFVRQLVGTTATLWIVEDIQWIDRTSAALLHYLLRRLSDPPLLLLFTSRPALDRDDVLSRFLRQPAEVAHLTLEPLDEDSVRELLGAASSGELPAAAEARIAELSGGNPYFALELLRAYRERSGGADDGPDQQLGRELVDDRLEGVLRERLSHVSVEGLKVLEAVAVLGGRASWELVLSLARVEVRDPSWICRQLTRQRLLRTRETEVEFAHDILRELVYADLGDIRRYSLHRMAAETLAREGEASRGVLANHFHRGGDSDRAFHYALDAARDAESRGAHQEAATYADVALSAAASSGDTPEGSEVELRRLAARAYSSAGDLAEAAKRLEPLLEREPVEFEGVIRGLLELAELRIDEAKIDEARASLRHAKRGIETSFPGPAGHGLEAERLSVELRLEIHDGERASIDAAGKRLRATLRARTSIGKRERERARLALAGYAAFFQSAEDARELIQDVREHGDSARLDMESALLLGTVEVRSCEWDRAEYLFTQGRMVAKMRKDVLRQGYYDNNLGCLFVEKGEWDKANEALTRAWEPCSSLKQSPKYRIPTLLNFANRFLYQLKSTEARQKYSQVLEEARAADARKFEAEARACLGLLDLQAGDRRAADRQYRKVRELIDPRSLSQEGFKIAWFSAFCGDEGRPATVLRERAESYRSTDTLSHLKLLWLAEISDGETEPAEGTRRQLRDRGLLWFEKFAERWMRMTRGNMAAA